MTIYTDTFAGSVVYPSDISFSALELDSDVILTWPLEATTSGPYATRIIQIDSADAAWSIFVPNATEVSTGQDILFNNKSGFTVNVRDTSGNMIVAVTSGTQWQIYLSDNSTADGVWQTFQYGAGISQANAASLAGPGLTAIGSLLGQSVPVTSFNSNYTAGASDRASLLKWTGAGGTLTLPDAATIGANWFILVANAGAGALVADPSGGTLIDGASTKSFQPTESAFIVCDGTSYSTVGFGTPAVFAFDYTSIDVSGTGDYTLSGSELNRIAYNFTGTLTGNRNIIVPATVQQYWVTNSTSGAYTLTVKTALGTGVAVASGSRTICYSDGTNVVFADTGGVSVPISIANGGTGATTASAARINLGGTSVGIALFTATDEAAAWAALGNSPGISGGQF